MYDVRRLRLLKELADRGTLAEVASALRYSPSSVSQQLDQLEREVGVPLLVPSGRGVVLTPEAQALAVRAGEVLALLERAESEVAARSEVATGTVRLAIFQSAALALLPETLTRMAVAHPAVRVEVVQHEPEAALRRTATRDFDLVVAEQYPGHATAWHDGLDHRPLVRDPIRLAVPPAAPMAGALRRPRAHPAATASSVLRSADRAGRSAPDARAAVKISRSGAPGGTSRRPGAGRPVHTRSGSSATALPDSTSRMCTSRSADS